MKLKLSKVLISMIYVISFIAGYSISAGFITNSGSFEDGLQGIALFIIGIIILIIIVSCEDKINR